MQIVQDYELASGRLQNMKNASPLQQRRQQLFGIQGLTEESEAHFKSHLAVGCPQCLSFSGKLDKYELPLK